jgi:hypothetical protein
MSVFAKLYATCECRGDILNLDNVQQLGFVVSGIVTTARNEQTIYIPSQNLMSVLIARKTTTQIIG